MVQKRGKNFNMAASEDGSVLEQSDNYTGKDNENKEKEKSGRLKLFQDLFKMCLNVIMQTGSPAQFKKYFKEIEQQNPLAFSNITEQLMNHLRTSIEAEIDIMINQEDLAKFFNTLDEVVAESKTKQEQAWRPSGDPTNDCRDHLMTVKNAYRDRMKAMLEKIEKDNENLEETVLPKRAKIEESQKQITEKAQHLKEASDLCHELNLDTLQKQAKAITNSS